MDLGFKKISRSTHVNDKFDCLSKIQHEAFQATEKLSNTSSMFDFIGVVSAKGIHCHDAAVFVELSSHLRTVTLVFTPISSAANHRSINVGIKVTKASSCVSKPYGSHLYLPTFDKTLDNEFKHLGWVVHGFHASQCPQ